MKPSISLVGDELTDTLEAHKKKQRYQQCSSFTSKPTSLSNIPLVAPIGWDDQIKLLRGADQKGQGGRATENRILHW